MQTESISANAMSSVEPKATDGGDLDNIGAASVLRKHVYTVHCSAPLTLKERICANVLLANAMADKKKGDLVQRQHVIPLADLAGMVNGERHNRARIRRTLHGLQSKRIYWAFTDPEAGERWGASAWLAGYEYKGGLLYYSYSAEIASKILEPDIFARLNFSIQNIITRVHTQTLYENCARYRDWGVTKVWDMETFLGLMGLQDYKSYREFKGLNRHVLKPAVSEINEKTEIFVEPQFRKRGRAVTAISFLVSENPNYDGPRMPVVATAVAQANRFETDTVEERADIYDRLLLFGIDHARAIEMLDRFDDDRILRNLQVVGERLVRGDSIRNVGGYAINAINKDYSEDVNLDEIQVKMDLRMEGEAGAGQSKEAARREQRVKEATKRLSEFSSIDFPRWRTEQWIAGIGKEEYEVCRQKFYDKEVSRNAFSLKKYKEDPDGKIIAALWRSWIRDNKLPPASEAERLQCAQDIGVDIEGLAAQAKPAVAD